LERSLFQKALRGLGRDYASLGAAMGKREKTPVSMKVEFFVLLLMHLAVLGVALAWLMP
jgi:hypothetical protein